MAANQMLAGTAYMTVDGVAVALVGEFSYKCSTPQREALMGQDGFHGFSSKPMPGEIKAKLRNTKTISVTALGSATDDTISVLLANGKTIIGQNLFTTEQPAVSGDDATIDVTWQGPSVTEA